MDQKTIVLTIIGMALVTYVPRLLPVWFLSTRTLPQLVVAWLRHVPVAVLAAMLLPALVIADGQAAFGWSNLFLWAAIPTLLVARKTQSLFGSVVTGVLVVAVVRLLLGQ
jgi:branched-subunit amino acid transport protein